MLLRLSVGNRTLGAEKRLKTRLHSVPPVLIKGVGALRAQRTKQEVCVTQTTGK
jgi:hypothetical protein